ncbi:MAG: RNA polymerase sigma factor [Chitinophagaceae bacterium]
MNQQPYQQSFLELIQSNRGIIYKICNTYCRDKNDREDLAQEIIYQLWKSGKRFDKSYKFSTWMYRIALNTAITFYRKDKRSDIITTITVNHSAIEDKNDSSGDLEENIKRLQEFINILKDLDKALMLLYLDSKPYAEIAEILGITETNVATKISRIKEKLKQHFTTVNQ